MAMEGFTGGGFFGSYQLLEEVGSGGAARVFRARHVHPAYAERAFALKILHSTTALNPDVRSRFRREAYVLSMLKHSGIVETFDAGIEGDDIYIAMEFVDGRDLHALLCQWGEVPLPTPVAVHIAGQILDALSYAHTLKDSGGNAIRIAHLDVKPANVLLSYDGSVKLTDFGVAGIFGDQRKIDDNGAIVGTKGYFAPEMLQGSDVDHRADIFAVGVLLYEMLCGGLLFDSARTTEVFVKNYEAKIPKLHKKNPRLPPGLEAVVLRALKRKPSRRFNSCAAMLEALNPYMPNAASMSVAVASLMRRIFIDDPSWRHRVRGWQEAASGSCARIAVCSPDATTRGNVAVQLSTDGFTVAEYVEAADLVAALRRDESFGAIVVDIAASGFSPPELLRAVTERTDMVPTVALCDEFDADTIRTAAAIGVADLIVKPPAPERTIWAVRLAVDQGGHGAPRGVVDPCARARVRLLLVSGDAELTQRLTAQLSSCGYRVDVSVDDLDAFRRGASATYHGVILDEQGTQTSCAAFAEVFRSIVGMGLVPVVLLVRDDDTSRSKASAPQRSAVRLRSTPPAGVAATLQDLLRATHLGRSFRRYPARYGAEIRFGGHSVGAQAVTISRGGILVLCCRIPPVNTAVGVKLWVEDSLTPLEMPGVVVQVDLPEVDTRARLRIAFTCGGELRSERRLIELIGRLDAG